MRMRKHLVWLLPLMLVSGFTTYQINESNKVHTVNTAVTVPEDSKNRASGYQQMGRGLELRDQHDQIVTDFTIELEQDTNDFNYQVTFINNTPKLDRAYLLVYLDYQQIPFEAGERSSAELRHEFQVDSWDHLTIPIRFKMPEDTGTPHSLLIQVVDGADKHAAQMAESSNFYATTARYLLTRKGSEAQFSSIPKPLNTKTFTSSFSGILINQDTKNMETIQRPPKLIKAKPGQKVDFALRAGGYNGGEDYVVWAMLDWKQIKLTPTSPEIYLHVPAENLAFHTFTLQAPLEKGLYEVAGFVMDSPWRFAKDKSDTIGGDRLYPITESSYRFTLQVE